MPESIKIPDAWLERLPEPHPVRWLNFFLQDPTNALDALLFERFFLDHDHPRERDELLADWVVRIGDADGFSEKLDKGLAEWVGANWGLTRADTSGALQARAWSAALHATHLCSPMLKLTAQALFDRFLGRVDWLGRWSTGPGQDPLGAMLLALTGYQTSRTLAPFWHQMIRLPDGVPTHHAAIAFEGTLLLPPEQEQRAGLYRPEFARALTDAAVALNNREKRKGIRTGEAHRYWLHLKRSALTRFPFERRWKLDVQLFLMQANDVEPIVRDWLYDEFGLDDDRMQEFLASTRKKGKVQWNPNWPGQAKELANAQDKASPAWRAKADKLISDQLTYARNSRDTHGCVRTLCRLSNVICGRDNAIAEQWARQAAELEPYNYYTYMAWAGALRAGDTPNLTEAVRVYSDCIGRCPDAREPRNALADLLKDMGRFDDALAQCSSTLEMFPEDMFARTILATVLQCVGLLSEAASQCRQVLDREPNSNVTLAILGNVLFRQKRFAEARRCAQKILEGDPGDSSALILLHRLDTAVVSSGSDCKMEPEQDAQRLAMSAETSIRLRRMRRHQLLVGQLPILPPPPGGSGADTRRTDLELAEDVFELLAAKNFAAASESLAMARAEFPHSAVLIAAQARMARMKASANEARLSEETKAEVLEAPKKLRTQYPELAPFYWLEEGLAYHALTDGAVRLGAVEDSFRHIRQIATQDVNASDVDALYQKQWAQGLLTLIGSARGVALVEQITKLSGHLDIREEEPIFRREAVRRWRPIAS